MVFDAEDEIVKAAEGIVLDAEDGGSQTEDDYKPHPNKRNATSQGRRKIDIEYISDKTKRHITFSKRKAGIMKKAYELAILTGTQVLLLVVSETGLVYTYTTPKLQPLVTGKRGKNLIQACLSEDREAPVSSQVEDPRPTTPTSTSAPPMPDLSSGPASNSYYGYSAMPHYHPTYAPYPHPMSLPRSMPHTMPLTDQEAPSPTVRKVVKRRKTTENLKKGRDAAQTAQISQVQEQAQQALNSAAYNPCLSVLFQAFNLHVEAQSISVPSVHPVSSTFTELQMSISAINEPSNQHYPSIHLNSPVESLLVLFDFFFSVYLPSRQVSLGQQEVIISDLINFSGWLLSHNFIDNTTHASLLRLCAPRSPPSSELQAIVRSNSQSREDRAGIMLSEYCEFSKNRYKDYWDDGHRSIEGTFSVLCVSVSFVLLDDCALNAEQSYIDATAPYKVRTATCLNLLLRRGDTIQCQIKKVKSSSFWLPVASKQVTPAKAELDPDYDPQVQLRQAEMDRCRRMDDQVGFALASVAFQKAQRADALLDMGEFDDENFVPSGVAKTRLRRVQSSL